jgi:hypothetical protein
MKVLLSLLFALNFLAIKSYFITELFDVYQIESECVAQYLNIEYTNVTENDERRCKNDIQKFERSILQTIEEILKDKEEINVEVKKCAVNLLKSYNLTSVVFRALAYHQKLIKFTTNSQQSCENVVKFNSTLTVMECGLKVLTVESIGVNKSFIHLKHCLNDLFYEFKADKIAFDDSDGGEISRRLFGKHFVEFLMQLTMMGVKYCESEGKIVVDDIKDIARIDIFGLTQPSKRVESCIIEDIQYEKHSKAFYQILFNYFKQNFSLSHKKLIEITLNCIMEF